MPKDFQMNPRFMALLGLAIALLFVLYESNRQEGKFKPVNQEIQRQKNIVVRLRSNGIGRAVNAERQDGEIDGNEVWLGERQVAMENEYVDAPTGERHNQDETPNYRPQAVDAGTERENTSLQSDDVVAVTPSLGTPTAGAEYGIAVNLAPMEILF